MAVTDLTPDGWDETIDVGTWNGTPIALLGYPTTAGPPVWRLQHLCDRRANDGPLALWAPRVQDGHELSVAADGAVAMPVPLLCSECGLYGTIADSNWIAAEAPPVLSEETA